MTVGIDPLTDAVNIKISGQLTALEQLQLSSVIKDYEQGFVKSVANCASLPDASLNKGRFIFLEDVCTYRWSDGTSWSNDFTSTLTNVGFSFGCNTCGILGTGDTTNRSSPVSIASSFSYWKQISAGFKHSIGISNDGKAWGWGYGANGRLGDGYSSDKVLPVLVAGRFTDWRQVSAGNYHSLGIRQNGTAWAWGFNNSGQLGDNTVTARSSPILVLGNFTDWCQISAGCIHSLGVRDNGTAWAWGFNSSGQLGDNTVTVRSSPVSVVGGFTDWCQVSAGNNQSLGVRQNGTIWGWGLNNLGQLGTNTVVTRSSPVSVVGGFTDWCQVSTGGSHSLAVRQNGTAWAWGAATAGVLGDGTVVSKSSPVSIVGGFTDWCRVSAGLGHSLAVRQNGTAWAWGCNSGGRLGDNTTVNKSSPVSVVGGFSDWKNLSAGECHSLGIRVIVDKGF